MFKIMLKNLHKKSFLSQNGFLSMDMIFLHLVNEDEGDERGEILLREARDVANEGTGVDCHQHDEDRHHPHANPQSERHVVPAHLSERRNKELFRRLPFGREAGWKVSRHSLAKVVDYTLEDEHGTRRAKDGERLAAEEAVDDAADEARDEGLHCGHVAARGFAQQAAECDDG